MQGVGCRGQGAGVPGCRVQGAGGRVQGAGARGAGCRVQGAGLHKDTFSILMPPLLIHILISIVIIPKGIIRQLRIGLKGGRVRVCLITAQFCCCLI